MIRFSLETQNWCVVFKRKKRSSGRPNLSAIRRRCFFFTMACSYRFSQGITNTEPKFS